MKKLFPLLALLALAGAARAQNITDWCKRRPYYPTSSAALRHNGSVRFAVSLDDKGEVVDYTRTGDEEFYQEVFHALKNCHFPRGAAGVHEGVFEFTMRDGVHLSPAE